LDCLDSVVYLFHSQKELEKLEIVLSASAFWRGGRKGGPVFALPPAEPVNKIGSDFFKYTPPRSASRHDSLSESRSAWQLVTLSMAVDYLTWAIVKKAKNSL